MEEFIMFNLKDWNGISHNNAIQGTSGQRGFFEVHHCCQVSRLIKIACFKSRLPLIAVVGHLIRPVSDMFFLIRTAIDRRKI